MLWYKEVSFSGVTGFCSGVTGFCSGVTVFCSGVTGFCSGVTVFCSGVTGVLDFQFLLFQIYLKGKTASE